jgi:peptide/nickel transport system permease protein
VIIFLARRFGFFVLSVLATSGLIFLLVRLLGGSPASVLLGEFSTPEDVLALEKELGLHRPLLVQYFEWMAELLRGDFGASFYSEIELSTLLKSALPVSVSLSVGALLVGLVIGIPFGIASALRSFQGKGSLVDFISQIGIALPIFWSGAVLSIIFGVSLGWFPTGGWVPWSDAPATTLRHLVLPSVTLGIGIGSVLARFVRTAIVEVMRQDFVRTGRAFGMSVQQSLFVVGLRNAALPVVTVLGNIVSHLVGGTVLTETLFSMPGLSRMILGAVVGRDIFVVQNLVMLLIIYVLVVNLIVDISYYLLDKRLRI